MMLCETCKKAIYSELWGECKCSVTENVVYDVNSCDNYANGTPNESQDTETVDCID